MNGARAATVTANLDLGPERPGRDDAEALCRAALAELLRRYGGVGGAFWWNGVPPGPGPREPAAALRLDLTLASRRIAGTITLTGTDLEDVPPERAAAHYLTLLAAAWSAADPVSVPGALAATDILSETDRCEIAAADGEPVDPGTLRPWPEIVAEQAARTPDAIAVRYEDLALSYADLERLAGQLAALLRAAGTEPGTPIAICMPRCAHTVVAALGVLKAGAFYVPLDPADPAARRNEILRDSGVRIILATGEPIDGVPGGVTLIWLDAEFAVLDGQQARLSGAPPSGDDAAYLLYTSGSTGRPKGVLVEHRQLAAYVAAIIRRFGIDRARRYALVQPLTVDSSVTALAVALATGGELHVLSRERALDAAAFADWMRRYDVDFLKIAPSHLRALQSSPRFPELLPSDLLVVGGEASSWSWLRDLQREHPQLRVVNHYGPTETTVGVLTLEVAGHLDADWITAPIGVALPGTTVTVADAEGREVPPGITGELVIGGIQVARGYHGVAARSGFAETDRGRRYRTGDRARRLAGGTVAFLGRDDDQVKVRGFRVTLGEIDAVLAEHPTVREVASTIAVDGSGAARVVAYVTPGDVDVTALSAHLKARLSPHMVPQAIMPMARLPLTPHGKLDRGALPPPEPAMGPGTGADGATPVPGLEGAVAAAWCDLLGIESVGPEQNFFDVGGHSLLLIDLQSRLNAETGKEVDLLELLRHPTVRAQAQLLTGSIGRALPSPRRSARQAALDRRRQQLRKGGTADG